MTEATELELLAARGGDNAAMIWGEQAAADGLRYAGSSNPVLGGGGMVLAAAGGWVWAFGNFADGFTRLLTR